MYCVDFIRCTTATCCYSCTTRCHLLSFDVPLVCLFINDPVWSLFLTTSKKCQTPKETSYKIKRNMFSCFWNWSCYNTKQHETTRDNTSQHNTTRVQHDTTRGNTSKTQDNMSNHTIQHEYNTAQHQYKGSSGSKTRALLYIFCCWTIYFLNFF